MLTEVDGKIVEEYDEFIDIEKPLSPKITKLTGISNYMLENDGIYEDVVAEDLKERLTPGTLMIAHNCQFDLSFIYNLLARHFPDEALDIVSNLDWLDTLTVLKDRKEYPHKLIDGLKAYEDDLPYNVEDINFHRAIDDTKALYDLTKVLKKERDDLDEYHNYFGYNPKWGVSGVRFPFIKYKKQGFTKEMVPPERILPRDNVY